MAGEQSELARDASETREKVWSNDDYSALRDNTGNPPATAGAPPSAQSGEQSQTATAPLPPRKQPDAAPAESKGQAQAFRAGENSSS